MCYLRVRSMVMAFLLIMSLCGCVSANDIPKDWIPDTEYKVNLLADAIYWAEGGVNTNYLYGIKSVRCDNGRNGGCREVCKRTIRNNIRRYENAQRRTSESRNNELYYINFLQGKYCPTTGNSRSIKEKELNGNWLNNVVWFLNNPKEVK